MQYITYPSIPSFQQHVELKDFRAPTKKEYVRYVRKLAEHFQCDPATLSEVQLREYFLFLRENAPPLYRQKQNPAISWIFIRPDCRLRTPGQPPRPTF